MAVAGLECGADRLDGLLGGALEDAEADRGELDAVVEGECVHAHDARPVPATSDGYRQRLLPRPARAYRGSMDPSSEVRDFLRTRRERVTPQQVGLPDFGGDRRVKGLRREELALIAGMSVDYYIRLERGNLTGVSESVLESLSRALRLDDAERAPVRPRARAERLGDHRRSPRVEGPADRAAGARRHDHARLGPQRPLRLPRRQRPGPRAVLAAVPRPRRPPNTAGFAFLDPRGQEFWRDWDIIASDMVAVLRAEAARHPYDKGLTDLIGELSTRSEESGSAGPRTASRGTERGEAGAPPRRSATSTSPTRRWSWRRHRSDPHRLRTEPGSPSEERLQLLANLVATAAAAVPVPETDERDRVHPDHRPRRIARIDRPAPVPGAPSGRSTSSPATASSRSGCAPRPP